MGLQTCSMGGGRGPGEGDLMPNWCTNRLAVLGSPEAVFAFGQKFTTEQTLGEVCENYQAHSDESEEVLDAIANSHVLELGTSGEWRGDGPLNRIVPMPPILDFGSSGWPRDEELAAALERLTGSADWYNWKTNNWGTKWDIDDPGGPEGPWFFDTAWAPPVEWAVTASERHPELLFVLLFVEPGVDFCGWLVAKEGQFRELTPEYSAAAVALRGPCPNESAYPEEYDDWYDGLEDDVMDDMLETANASCVGAVGVSMFDATAEQIGVWLGGEEPCAT